MAGRRLIFSKGRDPDVTLKGTRSPGDALLMKDEQTPRRPVGDAPSREREQQMWICPGCLSGDEATAGQENKQE